MIQKRMNERDLPVHIREVLAEVFENLFEEVESGERSGIEGAGESVQYGADPATAGDKGRG
jgi:hypothetical protein